MDDIEVIRATVKDILSTLPENAESSIIPLYYKFNENMEAHLDELKDEHERFYNISINSANNGWIQGFRTGMMYCNKTFDLSLKNRDKPKPKQQTVIQKEFITNFKPLKIYNWEMFILGIFSASFFWLLLVLFVL